MKEKILRFLKEKSPQAVSGEEISKTLGVSRTAIWKQIQQLKNNGYVIESRPNAGYRLIDVPDFLYPAEIKADLETSFLGQEINHYNEVQSTNDLAKRLAAEGAPDGLLVISEGQSGGRGRMGRQWSSPQGTGLWFSLVLRPEVHPLETPKLTVLAAVAVAKSIRKLTGLDAKIKWPNDILINNKKVCGILTELNCEMDRVNFVILGIGINVNVASFPEELKDIASSLLIEGGQSFNRLKLLQELLKNLESLYTEFLKGNYQEAWEHWRTLSCTIGNKVRINGQNWQAVGVAVDIDNDGALLLSMPTGEIKRFISGEVSLRPVD